MIVLVSGPYRSGTNDDPVLMAANLERLEDAAMALFEAGQLPMIGEWVALPLMRRAGSKRVGDNLYQKYAYPVAHRLIEHCDAVLRLPGASTGADEDIRRAKMRGIPVYYALSELI
ncbi:MAG: DUF4406 domain-containing protein [Hyphomonadaceae bacterium]